MHSSLRFLAVFAAIFVVARVPAQTPKKENSGATVAGLAELLKASGLTQPQYLNGLKSGLGTAVDFAVTELAKPNAFQLSGPASMEKLQAALVRANQTGALDSFKKALNQAASSVAPQTTAVLKDSLKGLSLDNVNALVAGGPDAATRFLRQAAEPALRTKLVPLVKQAIAANDVGAKVKDLATKAGPMAAMLGVPGTADLETYLLAQVLDTSFGYIAKQEASFRANPAQLKDANAAKVFAAAKK